MPPECYYFPKFLETDVKIILKDHEQHHLINVMRTKIGDEIEVVNGFGQLAISILELIEKKNAILKIKSLCTEDSPKQKIILAQGMPKLNRLEYILEK